MLKRRLALPINALFVIVPLLLTGCTTYTWPDGSQETVIGVVPEEENQRYEEERIDGVRYRIPDEIPEKRSE
ncbi:MULTISPECIES: hypothetical protein [unclassified Halomonas]|uniref:hypothetical protein n=1 Tax=unclassified Halomonas TaxID=2609666 RepID=UPI0007D99572|nr:MULTISPECIES: hypothetical protein [unclassified Halomonas]MBT2788906.1 hypothetical protein [Halomonas sp. ISL-106]MBT2795527.1 hypothetical protein [Halomonas sp. ISL-104]OAL60363.1 hypothetical protein A6R74_20235 [Halomonas sp. ALS9]